MKNHPQIIFILFALFFGSFFSWSLLAQTSQPYISNATHPELSHLIALRRNSSDSAMQFANQLMKEAISKKDRWLETEVTLELARIYYAKNDQETALALALKADKLSSIKNAAHYNAPQFSSYILNMQGKSEEALQQLFSCLKRAENAGANKMLSGINFSIADIYRESLNSKNALPYAKEGMKLASLNNDTSQLMVAYTTLGLIYSNSDYVNDQNLDTALFYYKKVMVSPYVNNWLKPGDSAKNFSNMGRLYRMHKDYALAYSYLKIGLEVADRKNYKTLRQFALNEQITLAMDKGNYPLAMKIAEGFAKDFPDNQNSLQRLKDVSQKLEQLALIKGDYKSAYSNLSKRMDIKDSLYGLDKEKSILEIEKKYQSDAKVLKAINLVQKKENERNLIVAISVLILVILLSLFLWYIYKRRQHAEFLKTLILEVNHRTKNNLQMLSVLISSTQQPGADEQSKTDIKKLKSYIKSFAMMYENLNSNASFDTVNLSDYIAGIGNAAVTGKKDNELKIEFKTESNIQLSTDKAILVGLIVNELITNSIKHAFSTSSENKITISLIKDTAGTVALAYEDNGEGKIQSTSRGGTFGVNMIQQLVKQMKGSIVYDAEKMKKMNIYFPAV
jgi:two-component sensor histidine kinase